MNKSELIKKMASTENITLKAAETAVNTVLESMTEALANGHRIEIRGVGSFKIKAYGGYQGRNPKTSEMIKVTSKKLPVFKPGKELKKRLNNGDKITITPLAPLPDEDPDLQRIAKI